MSAVSIPRVFLAASRASRMAATQLSHIDLLMKKLPDGRRDKQLRINDVLRSRILEILFCKQTVIGGFRERAADRGKGQQEAFEIAKRIGIARVRWRFVLGKGAFLVRPVGQRNPVLVREVHEGRGAQRPSRWQCNCTLGSARRSSTVNIPYKSLPPRGGAVRCFTSGLNPEGREFKSRPCTLHRSAYCLISGPVILISGLLGPDTDQAFLFINIGRNSGSTDCQILRHVLEDRRVGGPRPLEVVSTYSACGT